jgi:hypothetical protein
MNLLQDILGLFSRKRFISGSKLTADDYIPIARLKKTIDGTATTTDIGQQMKLVSIKDITPEIPKPTAMNHAGVGTQNGPGSLSNPIDITLADFHSLQISFDQFTGTDITIHFKNFNGDYQGGKQIYIRNQTNSLAGGQAIEWSLKFIDANGNENCTLHWPLGVEPSWTTGTSGTYDLVTLSGPLGNIALAVGVTDLKS